MAGMKGAPTVQLIVSYLFSVVINIGIIFLLIINVFKHGPRNVFGKRPRPRPKTLDDPRFGTHHMAGLKTVKLHYVITGVEKGPLMLLLHGFPEVWYSWRHQLLEFGKDYRVVAVDMRGYGESEKPAGVREYALDHLTKDVYELITYLGYEKAIIACHDWGGVVGWTFTLSHPEMVDKLIVCNCPHPSAFQKLIKTSYAQRRKSWYMLFFQMPWIPELYLSSADYRFIREAFVGKKGGVRQGTLTDEDVEVYQYSISQPGALTATINYYRAVNRYGRLDINTRQKVNVPVLMVWGDQDAFLEKGLAQLSGEYCNNFTLEYVAGASHWVQQEEPDKVNKVIRGFLGRKV